jgi:hypothetical protein
MAMRIGAALLITGLLLAGLPAAAADEWKPTAAGWVSGAIEHVGTVGLEAGTAIDAVLHGDHLYVTAFRSFSVYDVSDPADPQHLHTEPLVVGVFNEEPQTNGEILLLSRDSRWLPPPGMVPVVDQWPTGLGGGVLDIYDVTEPSSPQLLAHYHSEGQDHLWTCVLDCAYAYSATGTILDLRDPANPTQIGDWSEAAPHRGWHHIAEVAPGIVLTGSLPMHLLDANDDPSAPTLLASTEPATTNPNTIMGMEESLPARVAWPGATANRLAVVSMETPFKGGCSQESGEVQTFDTTGWQGTATFEPVDRYQISENGLYADGRPPANAFGCSAYGMDVQPDFGQSGGLVGVAFFEHGLRILDVDHRGMISEIAGFLPHAGNSVRPLWLSDELIHVVDLHRGIDILRVGSG